MKRSELIASLMAEHRLSRREAETAMTTITERIQCHLEQGGRVELRGFGTFNTKIYQAYRGRNPLTGAGVDVPTRRGVKFKASKALLTRVNESDAARAAQGLGGA